MEVTAALNTGPSGNLKWKLLLKEEKFGKAFLVDWFLIFIAQRVVGGEGTVQRQGVEEIVQLVLDLIVLE